MEIQNILTCILSCLALIISGLTYFRNIPKIEIKQKRLAHFTGFRDSDKCFTTGFAIEIINRKAFPVTIHEFKFVFKGDGCIFREIHKTIAPYSNAIFYIGESMPYYEELVKSRKEVDTILKNRTGIVVKDDFTDFVIPVPVGMVIPKNIIPKIGNEIELDFRVITSWKDYKKKICLKRI